MCNWNPANPQSESVKGLGRVTSGTGIRQIRLASTLIRAKDRLGALRVLLEPRRPTNLLMKAKTIVHVVAGEIKVAEEMDNIVAAVANGGSKPLGMTRITGHGTTKRIVVPSHAIVWLERA